MRYKLGDICDIYDGPHATPPEVESGPVFLGIKNINERCELDLSDIKCLSEDDYVKWTKRVTPRKDDIVFSYEATLNRYALIPERFYGCLGRRLAIARVKNTCIVNPHYLYHYFCSPKWNAFILANKVIGSTVLRISIEDFPEYEIELPDITVQNRAARILDDLSDKKRNNAAICSDLEAMAKLLYDYWFVQFDFPDENGRPYKSSGGKMVWNEELEREIPEGWEVRRLSDIASLRQNAVFPASGKKYNHYSIPAFDEAKMPAFEDGEVIASNKYLVPEGSVLVSKLNPQFKRIWLVLNAQDNAICSTEFLPIQATETGIYYLYSLLNTDAFSVYLKQKASSSTGSRKRIDTENVMSFQFVYNEKIASLLNEKMASIIELENRIPVENQQLASLRDFLLPMLMNGQVKVGKGGEQHEGA